MIVFVTGAIMKRVGIYLRVSTGGQTTENQRRELEAVAARSGWEVVGVYEDAGISGAKGRDKRPGFDRLLKDATARKVNMVAAWSVDRLGRSLQDLVGFLTELRALGCDLYLQIDLLFSDVVMPNGMSGVELAREARRLSKGIKVLLTSGYAGDVLERHGAVDEFPIIDKPYRLAELARRLRSILHEAQDPRGMPLPPRACLSSTKDSR
jgi:CheY-like chemotaxis protein